MKGYLAVESLLVVSGRGLPIILFGDFSVGREENNDHARNSAGTHAPNSGETSGRSGAPSSPSWVKECCDRRPWKASRPSSCAVYGLAARASRR